MRTRDLHILRSAAALAAFALAGYVCVFWAKHRFGEAVALLVLAVIGLLLLILGQQSRHVAIRKREAGARSQGERALQRVSRTLRTLRHCNAIVIRTETEAALFSEMCRGIVDVGGYRAAWVGTVEHDAARTIRLVACAGKGVDRLGPKLAARRAEVPAGWGTAGRAVRTGKIEVSQDIATDPMMAAWAGVAKEYRPASAAALPLRDVSGVFAILLIHAGEAHTFDADELKLLQHLADDVSYGVRALRDRQHKAALERRWRASLEATIGAIANIMEARDSYTAGHQQRVATLARAIARAMGLSENEVEGIYFASIIHDVGKIQVPIDILDKRGPLAEHEAALLRDHAEAGYRIVRHMDFPWPVAEMVRQHHERLDGSGYPRGLRGGAILRGARVLAVADVVEAMRSGRPYRGALGLDAALTEIRANKGRLFDPDVVDACIGLFLDKPFGREAAAAAKDTVGAS
jgi:putative nucleotidyltransferase with HDIG domain